MRQRTILLVDDSPEDCATFRRYLTRHRNEAYRIVEAACGKEALALLRHETPDCILLDIHLPDMNGLDILAALKDENDFPRFPIVMLTGSGNTRFAARAIQQGAQDYLPKDTLTAETLMRAIGNAIEKHILRQQVEAQYEELKRKNAELETQKAALEMANVRLCAREELEASEQRLEEAQQVAHVGELGVRPCYSRNDLVKRIFRAGRRSARMREPRLRDQSDSLCSRGCYSPGCVYPARCGRRYRLCLRRTARGPEGRDAALVSYGRQADIRCPRQGHWAG